MTQVTSGFRSILSHPFIYSGFQSLLGAHRERQLLVEQFIKPNEGMTILDIGCGPAEILAYLPPVKYWGFDISNSYIKQATKRFGNQGQFICKNLTLSDLQALPKFDMVLGIGLIHHLDDATAINILQLAYAALRPNGRLVTVDCCFDSSQNFMSRLLISHDRGQHVRTVEGYSALVASTFTNAVATLKHRRWIPYTHCIMECVR
jgi:SAM-dependent methyltransferase